ncbi:MmpS family transport accessory protein [Mycobacterium vicinigordonae]|uniref:MmpS family transport accessory protein n=1 Tax=Mycobacterium vicinigordonae TaxID=1719132 RepID=UPI001FE4F5C4|nr:MmpS family transport accessory protein [Mycobacterium vicinigordonae]
MVVVAVLAVAAFAVFRLHGIFGSQNINASAGGKDESKNVIPKDVVYQIFGPPGTHGQVDYLDEYAQPKRAEFSSLPWSFDINTLMTSVFASVVAQGDSDTIGCRIVVNGVVRDEHTVSTRDAQASCLAKAA